ncbi:caspase family protein [Bauldia sp.]|uniref:caspase family protein n=1 Tax=Bauldia sp. TaxID=2575872 RepID=UPI003BAC5F11
MARSIVERSRLVGFAAALAVGLLPAGAAEHVALIVGNGAYPTGPNLSHPAEDAADLADTFTGAGFAVIHLTDADGPTLREAIREFEDDVEHAAVAVVYFGGRALAGDGINYILPVDARLASNSHLDDEGVPVSRLIAAVDDARDVRLVILDTPASAAAASLSSALGRRQVGDAATPVEPTGAVTVVTATGPIAMVDENGVYAETWLAHLETHSVALSTLLDRVHGEVTATTDGIITPVVYGPTDVDGPLIPDPDVVAALDRAGRPTVPTPAEIADAFRRAERLGTVEAWDGFLQFCTPEIAGGVYCTAGATTRQTLLDSDRRTVDLPEIAGDGSGTTSAARVDLRAVLPGETPQATCNRLAAHGYDPDKPIAAVGTDLALLGLVADVAVAACTEAVDAAPDERRYAFQLGRAYHAGGDYGAAMAWYTRAAEAGSSAAMSNIGFLHASGAGVVTDFDAAHEWYRRSADAGNVAAMSNLASLYQTGSGVPTDFDAARHWYGRAAAGGNAVATNALGLLHQDGLGGPQDLDEARALFEAAADEGVHEAINNLARLYNYGRGVAVDYVQARQLYEDAAALGNGAAMVNLGLLYENGQGVRRDYRVARDWYERAAARDDSAAMNNLGILYQYGRGTPENLERARHWYEVAAARGNAAAMANLAYLYDGGRGVPIDKVKARTWYLRGAEAGNGPAMASIGYLYANGEGGQVDYDAALDWYRRGADIGNAEAMANLGFMYEVGWGVEKDMELARAWYERGANAGNAIAMANLGLIYENGNGIEADMTAAFDWYVRAAEAGNAQGMASLAYFYSNAIGTDADQEAALEWYTRAANLGNTIAMHNLGVAYKDGLGTEPNLRRATDLFVRALEARNTWTFDQFRDEPGNYPSEVIAGIERYLIGRGYLEAEPDGEMDDAARAALDRLQADLGG